MSAMPTLLYANTIRSSKLSTLNVQIMQASHLWHTCNCQQRVTQAHQLLSTLVICNIFATLSEEITRFPGFQTQEACSVEDMLQASCDGTAHGLHYLQQSTQLGLPSVPPTTVSTTKSAMFDLQPSHSLDLVQPKSS